MISIENIKKFIYIINDKYSIDLAYLFGSVARNQYNKDSDIDIAIKFKNKYSKMDEIFIRGEIIDIGKAYFKRNVDIVSLDNAPIALKYEIIKDGILLIDCYERVSIESLIIREYFDFKYFSDIYDKEIIKRLKDGTYFGGENG
ncbi:nucleotidyltransferase domain protein [Clostridium argentinense CDC 2741]|uniref:Nucleotidyltransferase domain protein n=1 Tax=Clostridium argentinense CDC 2741 TaxID=1418104 RepID=A0A0C1TXH0_9CLOT|nr:nucleotidyltransferase domain-containing protein [Clostridium argentinense]ARC86738.1 nucleotidyltransferase [Clostridium argentinense]KIE45409.1 nucleotidyltransferase domain protein [Clostridium argentinense CDC 2741]NFF38483.1 nucleotidyltransferase domain-containing protein [Clostridium argentinense]NFP49324.1 nucleotidyltransferase domain-containing protein [Clostridium argentinense]NFP71727.1 nucleotidyltransferase domain-containing protein [Clostridium argentinense]